MISRNGSFGFTPLDADERQTIEKMVKRGRASGDVLDRKGKLKRGIRTAYVEQVESDPRGEARVAYTMAMVRTNGHLRVGVAKRSPKDKEDRLVGQRIALARAVSKIAEVVEV